MNKLQQEHTRPKVILRAMELEDLDLMYSIENDRGLWNVGATNVPYSRQALHKFISSTTYDIYADKQVRLIMTNQDDDFIGIIDLYDFDPQHLRAELGIVVREQYRYQGYGIAAVEELIAYSRSVLHLHQLYAIVSVDNTYCVKLLTHAGFEHGAELKDWLFDGDTYHNACLLHFFCKKTEKSFVE